MMTIIGLEKSNWKYYKIKNNNKLPIGTINPCLSNAIKVNKY